MKLLNCRIILCVTILIALTASLRPARTQPSGQREFVGTINSTLRVRIRLLQSGEILTGSYAYERTGGSLRLSGALTLKNEFHLNEFYLNEFDERGTRTGKFKGAFVSEDWLEGTWSAVTTKRELPFSAWAVDGKQIPAARADDRMSGNYRRVTESARFDRNSSELSVWLLKNGRVRVKGVSSWVSNARSGGVNFGGVDGIFDLQGKQLFYKHGAEDHDCRFTITFGADSLLVTEDNLQCGGWNVSFDGKYRKVGPAK